MSKKNSMLKKTACCSKNYTMQKCQKCTQRVSLLRDINPHAFDGKVLTWVIVSRVEKSVASILVPCTLQVDIHAELVHNVELIDLLITFYVASFTARPNDTMPTGVEAIGKNGEYSCAKLYLFGFVAYFPVTALCWSVWCLFACTVLRTRLSQGAQISIGLFNY